MDSAAKQPAPPLRIGCIGLGTMGHPMAARLSSSGHLVRGFDRAADASRRFAAASPAAAVVGTLEELATSADIITTCLPTIEAVQDVYFNNSCALSRTVQRGTIVVEHSTIPPTMARELERVFADREAVYVEAPLFGGIDHARKGTLYVALSGSNRARQDGELVESLATLLREIARAWSWVGSPGSAMLTKVLQNGLGLAQLTAMAETAAACKRLGVDPDDFYRVVIEAGGMAASPLFRERFPLMLHEDVPIDARLAIAAKDAALCSCLIGSEPAGSSPLAASAAAFAVAEQRNLSDWDVTAVWRVFLNSQEV